MLDKFLQYFRVSDWLDSKVPFMAGVLLFSLWFGNNQISDGRLYLLFIVYLIYVSMFLAFSYVINDYTDLEVDRAAGKQKVMHSLPKSLVLSSLFAMVVVGCVPLYFYVSNKLLYICFTAFMYLCGAAYSVRGLLRFKERGFVGLLECSVAQKCLPMIPILFVCAVPMLEFVLLLSASFINGLRYILIHQAIDLQNDKKTGVKTFVSEKNINLRRWIIVALLVEVALLSVVFIKICIVHPAVALFLALYVLLEYVIAIVVVKYMSVDLLCTYLAVPLEALYNVFFPLIIAIILCVDNYRALGIPITIAALVVKCFLGKAAFVKVFFQTAFRKEK